MSESITVRFTLPVPANRIYNAWLDGAEHSAMTGAKATASKEVGGEFTAWDGYIRGKNLLLISNQKIVQSWRSAEFPEEAADSVLSVRLTERQGLTEVEIEHTDIPAGFGLEYQAGWIEYYANPMQKYFAAGKTGTKLRPEGPDSGRRNQRGQKKKSPAGKKVKSARKPAQVKKTVAKPKKKSGRVRIRS